jgi:predicted SAM-dependent methyltransferase
MDDPAFAAFRQATEAFNRQEYQHTVRFAREALTYYPQHLMAHYFRQAALVEMRWDEAVRPSPQWSAHPKCFVQF